MVNRVILLGRLGQDVELRYTPTGIPVSRLNVATDGSYKKDGETVKKTDWHRVIVFGRTAENCANFLGKGRLVYIEGSLSTRKWTDAEGIDRYSTEINAKRVQFLDHANAKEGAVDNGNSTVGGDEYPTEFPEVSF